MTIHPDPNEQDDDPIVAEVRAIRQQELEKHGGIENRLRHIRELDAQLHAPERDLAEDVKLKRLNRSRAPI